MDKKQMREMIATRLEEMAQFLVPTGKPNKLCKNWYNMAETSTGEPTFCVDKEAVRFCILGGYKYLFNTRLFEDLSEAGISYIDLAQTILDKYGIDIGGSDEPPTSKQIRLALTETAKYIRSL